MKKIYVLDTNVLLHDPNAIFSFEDNEIVIPLTVIVFEVSVVINATPVCEVKLNASGVVSG